MNKALLLALALIVVGCAKPEPIPRKLDGLVQQGDVYLDRETMKPYSGAVFEFFPDDTTKVQLAFTLRDGKTHGLNERYLESGQLSSKRTYNNGELHGLIEIYDENGQPQLKGNFNMGEWHGPVEQYRNGQLSSKVTYNMGEKCGEWVEEGRTTTYDPCPPDLEDGN